MFQRTRFILLVVGAAAVLLLSLPHAVAHSIVKSTEPRIDSTVHQPPERVVMVFNEPVEVTLGSIRVFDTNGRRVDVGPAEHPPGKPDTVQVALQPSLPNGTYIVSWRIISADSHPIQEAFLFHVGHPGQQDEAVIASILSGQGGARPVEGFLFGVARWVNFAGTLMLAGAFAFAPLVWRRRGLAVRPPEVEEGFSRRWRGVLLTGWAMVLAATLAAFVLQGAVGAGVSFGEAMTPRVLGEVLRTRFGAVNLAKLALVVAAAGLWLAARRAGSIPLVSPRALVPKSLGGAALQAPIPPWFLGLGAAVLVGLLAMPALAGHAGATRPVPVNLVADIVHMLAAAVWVGGLASLLFLAFPATRSLSEDERVRTLAPVVARFSAVAFVAVAVLVGSGVVRGFLEVRALRALFGSTYGLVLLAKLAAFLPMLGLGAVNRYWTTPKLERAAAPEGPPFPLRVLRRLVATEVALSAVVLAITAFLVVLPPARVEAGIEGPFVTDVAVGDHTVEVMVDPNQAGMNMVHLSLSTQEGLPAEAEEVRVLFRMPEQDIGPIEAIAEPMSHGAYLVHGHQLSVAGRWTLEVVVVVDRFTEHRATIEVNVNP